FLPQGRPAEGPASRALPTDLRKQATTRLSVTAIIYSTAFFLADLFAPLVGGEILTRFQKPERWVPSVLSILGGLGFAALASSRRVRWGARVNLGLVFRVRASYGIALAMYLELPDQTPPPMVYHVLSPSWVAIWMLFYAIVVPAPPGRALLALI